MKQITLTELSEISHLSELENMQRAVWGPGDLEVIPVSHLRAVLVSGGMILGAFDGEELLGFAYGFPAFAHEPYTTGFGIHSHMVAVRKNARGKGVGQALKQFQKQWCLERDMTWMSWTFDPLQRQNARLNLHHLGAVAHEYFPNFYGLLPGELGGNQESDRLLAVWHLQDEVNTFQQRARNIGEITPILVPGEHTEGAYANPVLHDLIDAPAISIAVPQSATELLANAPDVANTWRRTMRSAFTTYLKRGYVAADFHDGAYVLIQATD